MKSIIAVISIAVVLLAAAVVVALRWNVWFGNPVEPGYTAHTHPYNILLTFGDDAASRTLTWQCDTLQGNCTLHYSLRGSGDTTRVEASPHIYHSTGGASAFYCARMATPTPGTYDYRITDDCDTASWRSFTVNDPASAPSLQFIYMGDIQDTLGGITGETTAAIAARFPQADFYVLGGDLIHRPMEQYWNEAFSSIGAFAANYPTLAVTGNHEYPKGIGTTAEPRFALHFAGFLPTLHSEGLCYNTLRYGPLQLFLLDSNSGIAGLLKQRIWLVKALEQSTARWKVVVLHHPPYSIRNPYNNLDVKWLYTALFKQPGVDWVLAGHEHGYARLTMRDAHGGKTSPVYTVSHCSPKQYPLAINNETDRLGTGDRYFQHFTICGDTLHMITYTTSLEVYDDVMLIKDSNRVRVTDNGSHLPERLSLPRQLLQRMDSSSVRNYRNRVHERMHQRLHSTSMPAHETL